MKKTKSCRKKQRRTSKRKSLILTVLGHGKDGCIVQDPKDPSRVFKVFRSEISNNEELQKKIKEIDPEENRFSHYSLVLEKEKKKLLKQQCEPLFSEKIGTVVSMKRLDPLDTGHMTREQYRHLRTSIELLHEHEISHGDLIGNIMMDPEDQLPRIIDWEDARFPATPLDKDIDRNAFLSSGYFKIRPLPISNTSFV